MIAYKLKRSNLVGLILAETSMVWMSFIVSKLLCRKSSSSSSIIPNFYLGSQPSGIPLIFARVAFWFSTHQGTLYCLSFSFSFSLMLFFVLFFFFLLPPFFLSSSSFSDMATGKASIASTSHRSSQHLPP